MHNGRELARHFCFIFAFSLISQRMNGHVFVGRRGVRALESLKPTPFREVLREGVMVLTFFMNVRMAPTGCLPLPHHFMFEKRWKSVVERLGRPIDDASTYDILSIDRLPHSFNYISFCSVPWSACVM